nr:DUF2784 family protein [Burkholderiaceae bacterium]
MEALPGDLARVLADAVLVVHAAFVAWVVLGGFAVAHRPALAWLHLPAAARGAAISFGVWASVPVAVVVPGGGAPPPHAALVPPAARRLLAVLVPPRAAVVAVVRRFHAAGVR